MNVVLEAAGITKSFGGVRALRGVSLALAGGEIHALVGENGAGKSTLIKILTGALLADSGEIRLRGDLLLENTPAKARSLGIGVIYQQPALFPDLTVAENIALAIERTHPWRKIDWRGRRNAASKLLQRVGAHIRPEQLVATLSMPEQQLVEIAKAIETEPSVLILDEPTASLGHEDVEHLFKILTELRARGTAIVYVSHRFAELFRMADTVTILRDGTSIETRAMRETSEQDLIRLMVGRELSTVFPEREVKLGPIALSANAICCRRTGVEDVTLDVRCGEVLGLAGLVGSGRTQFAEALFGLTPVDSGEIQVNGRQVAIRKPADATACGIAYVPEDRRRHGVVLDMSVAKNTTLANLRSVSSKGFLRLSAERRIALDYIQRLSIKTPTPENIAGNLSGGNQQKVSLARWLMTKPEVLILDEPTQGIDVGAKAEIYDLIGQLAQNGVAILLISSDMHEVLGMSDRIAVMSRGRIAGVLSRAEADPFKVLGLALGHRERLAG